MSTPARQLLPRAAMVPGVDRFFRVLSDRDLEGIEQSWKLSAGTLLTNRFMAGVDASRASDEELLQLCRALGMPADYVQQFTAARPQANQILFGVEEATRTCIYKVYLEYWHKVTAEVTARSDKGKPILLHLGFKWDALDSSRKTVARYICYPLLTVSDIVRRVTGIYEGHGDRTSLGIASDILNFALGRAPKDGLFIYVEATEEGNPRRSFDVNMYKAGLQMGQLRPFLSRMFRHYEIPGEQIGSLCARAREKMFGHLAGGVGRDGRDFLTVYFELC